MRTVSLCHSAFFLPGLLFFVVVSLLPAAADSIQLSISGTADFGATTSDLHVSAGDIFSATSAAPDAPASLLFGTVGNPESLTITPSFYSGFGFTEVRIGSSVTDILFGGGLRISSSFTVPASALFTGSFTAPVTVFADLQPYTDLTYGTGILTTGPLLGDLNFTGRGTATFSVTNTGENTFLITYEFARFSGTGTLNTTVHITPEPTSLILLGTGLAGVALAFSRRRSSHSAQVPDSLP